MRLHGSWAVKCFFLGAFQLLPPEAYLFHGSNPTSAISILSTSFKVDFAGAAVGTMFGPGAFLAELSHVTCWGRPVSAS